MRIVCVCVDEWPLQNTYSLESRDVVVLSYKLH